MSQAEVEKKIVVGFSGGLKSLVSAYLLKKQGFKPIAIGIEFKEPNISDKYYLLYNDGIIFDLGKVKELCDQLDIPFYAVKANLQYQHFIIDQFVTSRVTGERFSIEIATHNLILQILKKKSEELGVADIATGHFAKLYKNFQTGQARIGIGNDPQLDQSHLLCQLNQEELANLQLPLSEIRMEEVHKLAQKLEFTNIYQDLSKVKILPQEYDEIITKFVADRVPEKLIAEGPVFSMQKVHLGDHRGLHYFRVGQKNIKVINSLAVISKDFEIISIDFPRKLIYIGDPKLVSYNQCFVDQMYVNKFIDRTGPMHVYAYFKDYENCIKGKIIFKNSQGGVFKFNKPVPRLVVGERIVFYNKDEKGGLIIGHARVAYFGDFEPLNRLQDYISHTPEEEEDGPKIKEVEFRF